MSISITIVPLQNSLRMFGDPSRSSVYSLSGHVEITLSSYFLGRKPSKVLLQSLALTLEGQCEVSAPSVGYFGLRLCSITTELISHDPVLLSNEGNESEPCHWNAVFNINVPGWLPASSFGIDNSGIQYRLFATAKYVDVEARKRDLSQTSLWSLSSIYSAICSGQREAAAYRGIIITRFFGLPSEEPKPIPLITFLFRLASPKAPEIPTEVISKIQILVSVPEYTSVKDHQVALTLRLRTNDLPAEECRRLQLLGFRVDVVQKEKYRVRPSQEYKERYPLPADDLQPPTLPLRWTSMPLYAIDYAPSDEPDATCHRIFSLRHPSEEGRYDLQTDNYVFAKDAEVSEKPTWFTLQTKIPIVPCAPRDDRFEWAGKPILRPSSTGPLVTILHELVITLPISYDIPGSSQKVCERLTFSVPLRFAKPAPSINRPRWISSSKSCLYSPLSFPVSPEPSALANGNSSNNLNLDFDVDELPHSPVLPPYFQHYHLNGDRKIDPTPLPLYSPPGVPVPERIASPGDESNGRSLTDSVLVTAAPFSQKVCDVA